MFCRTFLPISKVLRMIHFISKKDKIFSQVCIHPAAKAGLALFGPFTLVCTIVLEEERGQKTGDKWENKAIVDIIIISKWKFNEYPLYASNLHIHSWFFFFFFLNELLLFWNRIMLSYNQVYWSLMIELLMNWEKNENFHLNAE